MKPYEVFTGIWKTDATAKVFGYLDSRKPPLSKSTEQIPMQRQNNNHRTHLQSPALARRLLDRYREVHNDDGTDDFSRRAHRQHVEAWDRRRQERRDEAKREREASRRSAMRARMRTVSRDDELVQRGANPRTGVVSPELVTNASGESVGDDQIAVRQRKESGRKKEGSGKWKQNDLGWSLEESPSFSPSAESKEPGRAVLVDKLQDQFVVVMPGVDNPAPAEMTPTQIQNYQERFRDIYSYGRADPAEVGLRQWMPEPRNRVHNIPRKEAGSGHAQRNGSTDTVIIQDQLRAPFLSTPRKDIMRDRRVRIVTPLPTSASNSPVVDRNDRGSDSGSYPEKVPSQTTDSINQMCYPKIHCRIDHLPEAKAPDTSTPTSLAPRKYIPRLDFLHPSQFSSPTTSYRRPKELQPAHLRAVKTVEKTNRIQDASPNVISGRGLRIEEGSQTQLQDWAAEIPGASLPNSGQERRCQNVAHGTQLAITSFLPTTPKASKTALKVHNVKVHKNRIVPDALGTDMGDRTKMVRNDEGAVKQLEEHSAAASCSCTRCNSSPSHAAIELITSKKGLSPRNANIAQTPRQNKAGYVQVNENTERTSEGISGAKMRSTTRTRTQSAKKPPGQVSEGPPELNIVDYRARGVDDDKHDEQNKKSGVEGLVHEASTLGIVVGLWRLIGLVEQKFYDSIRMRSIQRRLTEMIHHVLLTLHTSSPALEVLRMPNATMEEYLAALKDVIRAIFYILVLLNIVMVLGKFLRLAALAIHLLWLPLKMVLLVVRWFISG